MNPFTEYQYILFTLLTPQQCREQLQAELDAQRRSLWDRWIQGEVYDTGFAVRRFRMWGHNALAPSAVGELIPTPGGTRIRVRVGTHRPLLALWIGLPLFMTIVSVLTTGGLSPSSPLSFVPPVLLVVFASVAFLGPRINQGDRGDLLRFLLVTLEAEDRTPSGTRLQGHTNR
jgi:hypothetical protein